MEQRYVRHNYGNAVRNYDEVFSWAWALRSTLSYQLSARIFTRLWIVLHSFI